MNYFTKNPNLEEKKNIFLGGGVFFFFFFFSLLFFQSFKCKFVSNVFMEQCILESINMEYIIYCQRETLCLLSYFSVILFFLTLISHNEFRSNLLM